MSRTLIGIALIILLAALAGGYTCSRWNRKNQKPRYRARYTKNDTIYKKKPDLFEPIQNPVAVVPELTVIGLVPDTLSRRKAEKSTILTATKVETLKKKPFQFRYKPAPLLVTTSRIQPNSIPLEQAVVVPGGVIFQVDSTRVNIDRKSLRRQKFKNTLRTAGRVVGVAAGAVAAGVIISELK